MLGTSRIVPFIPVLDRARAREFYESLGLTVEREDAGAVVVNGNGVDVRLTEVDSFTPQPFTVLGWEVGDVHSSVDALADRGIEFLRFPGMDQDDRAVWTAPGGAQVVWFRDPDGNTLSLTQPPPV